MRDYIVFYLNGKRHQLAGQDVFQTLSNFVRYQLQKTGTKVVCEEGDCGACTVLIGRAEKTNIEYKPINSCIQNLYQLDCTHLITIEGLNVDHQLNAVQESMVNNHGAQCGFCTPGFIVSMCALFDRQKNVDTQTIKDSLTGNLCRCTGYEPIIKACLETECQKVSKISQIYPPADMLKEFDKLATEPVLIETGDKTYFNPTDVKTAVDFKSNNPTTVIVAGGTDVCVQMNKRDFDPKVIMNLSNIDGMKELKIEKDVLIVGARVSLYELEQFVRDEIPELQKILWVFGGEQIKHAATLAGNIANGSPIADTVPFLFVMDAELELSGKNGKRTMKIDSLYKGYKSLNLAPDELITSIRIPLVKSDEVLKLYKVSKRKHLDISTFTAAIKMQTTNGNIDSIKIAYGGVGPVVMRLPKTEAFLKGKPLSLQSFEAAGDLAKSEIWPISDVRGAAEFRNQLAANILSKFFYDAVGERELVCR